MNQEGEDERVEATSRKRPLHHAFDDGVNTFAASLADKPVEIETERRVEDSDPFEEAARREDPSPPGSEHDGRENDG